MDFEVFEAGPSDGPVVCAAHPAAALVAGSAELLVRATGWRTVVVNPRGVGASGAGEPTFAQMVDDLEVVRAHLGVDRWCFWGMSGGGWLAQLYARRHPEGLTGIVVESVGRCFRVRLADPACILSPRNPLWAERVANASLEDGWNRLELGEVYAEAGEAVLVSPEPVDDLMKRRMPLLLSFDARDWLGGIEVAAAVVAGGQDPVAPAHRVREVHHDLPHSAFLCIDEAGHVPVMAFPERVGAWVRERFSGGT